MGQGRCSLNPHILTTEQVAESVRVNGQQVTLRLLNLSLALLQDPEGISDESYHALISLCRKVSQGLADQLTRNVDNADGRWFLPKSKVAGVTQP